MKGKRKIKKENNKKLYIIIAIIVIVIATICIININMKKQPTNDNLNNSNDGIALYNTTLGEYVKQTEDGIKLNTSDLVNSDKILGNLTITDIQLTYNSGITSLTAKVINNSDTETGISTITATLIDKDKNEICNPFLSKIKTTIIVVISYLVENTGLEPVTLCVQGRCSSQLSQFPI